MPRLNPAFVLDWDMSMCLECHLRQTLKSSSHHFVPSSASSPTLRCLSIPARFRFPSTSRSKSRSFHTYTSLQKPPNAASHVRAADLTPPTLFRGHTTTLPDEDGEEDKKPPVDMRARLAQWLIQRKENRSLPQGLEPLEPKSEGDIQNNFTRPEDLKIEADATPDEQETSAEMDNLLASFDRITDVSNSPIADVAAYAIGDLVYLDFGNLHLQAVFLGMSKATIYQFYGEDGNFLHLRSADPSFRAKQYFTREEVDSLKPFLPEGAQNRNEHYDLQKKIPDSVHRPLLQKFARFGAASRDFYRTHAVWLDNAHQNLAHPTDITYKWLPDIARELIGPPEHGETEYPPHVINAINQTLLTREFGFFRASSRSHGRNRCVGIFSRQDAAVISRVQEYTRAYQEEAALEAGGFAVPQSLSSKSRFIKDFVKKASTVRAANSSRHRAAPDGTILFSLPENKDMLHSRNSPASAVLYSSEELDIIHYLKMEAFSMGIVPHLSLKSMHSVILRAFRIYTDTEAPTDFIFQLLVQMGIADSFVPKHAFDEFVFPPCRELDLQLLQAQAEVDAGKSPAKFLELQDNLKHLRKDWGDMPVYCVDPPGAKDHDDGISFEPVPDSGGHAWVHVHIAHISSIARPGTPAGKLAEQRLFTQYLTADVLPMFPIWISELGSIGSGSNVLTFSGRFDKSGSIVETKVQAGTVHNVRYVTPNQVNSEVFGLDVSTDSYRQSLKVGEGPTPERKARAHPLKPFTEEEKSTIRELYSLALNMYKSRPNYTFETASGDYIKMIKLRSRLSINVPKGSAFVKVHDSASLGMSCDQNPSIEFAWDRQSSNEFQAAGVDPPRILVEQFMIMAGVVMGRFAAERGIPVVYTGSAPKVENVNDLAAGFRQDMIRDPHSTEVFLSLVYNYGLSKLQSDPIEQRFIGETYWAKATSPLRRFFDLVSHWQIDAALIEEAKRGQSLVGSLDVSFLPYNKLDLDRLLDVAGARAMSQMAFKNAERKHWRLQLLARAFYLKEAELPTPLICTILDGATMTMGVYLRCIIKDLDSRSLIPTNVAGVDGAFAQPMEVWEVEISQVNLRRQYISVMPVRRISSAPGVPETPRI